MLFNSKCIAELGNHFYAADGVCIPPDHEIANITRTIHTEKLMHDPNAIPPPAAVNGLVAGMWGYP
jgi:hypothetical protein